MPEQRTLISGYYDKNLRSTKLYITQIVALRPQHAINTIVTTLCTYLEQYI